MIPCACSRSCRTTVAPTASPSLTTQRGMTIAGRATPTSAGPNLRETYTSSPAIRRLSQRLRASATTTRTVQMRISAANEAKPHRASAARSVARGPADTVSPAAAASPSATVAPIGLPGRTASMLRGATSAATVAATATVSTLPSGSGGDAVRGTRNASVSPANHTKRRGNPTRSQSLSSERAPAANRHATPAAYAIHVTMCSSPRLSVAPSSHCGGYYCRDFPATFSRRPSYKQYSVIACVSTSFFVVGAGREVNRPATPHPSPTQAPTAVAGSGHWWAGE